MTVEQVAAQIASKDVKGTYDGLVMPRKLPAPNGVVDAAPLYKAAIAQARPALLKHFHDTFARTDRRAGRADHAGRRRQAGPGGEQPADVPALHPQHGSGQQRGHPRADDPRRARTDHADAGRALARRAERRRRALARPRADDRESARPHAATRSLVLSSGRVAPVADGGGAPMRGPLKPRGGRSGWTGLGWAPSPRARGDGWRERVSVGPHIGAPPPSATYPLGSRKTAVRRRGLRRAGLSRHPRRGTERAPGGGRPGGGYRKAGAISAMKRSRSRRSSGADGTGSG